MKILIVLVVVGFLVACGGDPKPAASIVPVPQLMNDKAQRMPDITLDELLAPQVEQVCSSSSDCAGNGKCSGGKCGSCSSSSDCNGNGKCSSGKCGSCSSSSDCKTGKCSGGKCGGCSSSSDCNGNGKCSSGVCGSCSSSSDCSIGKCNNSKCGGCSSSSDCKGGKCESGRCSNYTN